MSFAWLSPLVFFAGLAGLAGVLFALQRLRVRHRTVMVPTTLFWREALEDTRARVFVQRFRHPWAYLLVLAIAALAWLAVAGPLATKSGTRDHLLVLDVSARMAVGSRFDDALRAIADRAAELPRHSTRVVAAGAHVRTLLEQGEELPLLERRAFGLAPEACPSTLPRALVDACAADRAGRDLVVEVFGDSPIEPRLIEVLGPGVEVHRAASAAVDAANSGLVTLGVSDAASGAWNRVDVTVGVLGPAATSAHVALEGKEVPVEWRPAPDTRGARAVLRDVVADGGRVSAWVDSGDALALDDRATLVLPIRSAVRVALSPGLPEAIAIALRSDPGVTIVEEQGADRADVVVRGDGEAFGGSQPALVLCSATKQEAAFVIRHPDTGEHERTLRAAFDELGLDEIDATELAGLASRPITLELELADARGISVWSSLFEPRYDFTSTRAFPLFIARAVRWLAGARAFEATCASGAVRLDAGQPGPDEPWTDARGVRIDTLGQRARFPRAGETVVGASSARTVSLLDADTTSLAEDARALPPVEEVRASFAIDPLTIVVLALMALILVEWWLVRTERVP